MSEPTLTDLAWAAGIFEGEGSVGINAPTSRNPGGFLRVSIHNNDRGLVEPFSEWWGGSVSKTSPPKSDRWRQGLRWHATGVRAAAFLAAILPFLRSERQQARVRLALEFQAQKQPGRRANGVDDGYMERQRDFTERMRALNARGPRPTTTQEGSNATE